MPKVTVTLEFDSTEEAASFFGSRTAVLTTTNGPAGVSTVLPYAAPAASVPPVTTPTPTNAAVAPTASVIPATATAGPVAADPAKEAHAAMITMITRLDARQPGQGAANAKAILNQHGFTRARDVTADKVPALIAAFNAQQ